jgi:hypothetical protein
MERNFDPTLDKTLEENGTPAAASDLYLTPDRLAKLLGKSNRTLSRWHTLRVGPPRIAVGNLILYRASAVRDWLRDNEQHGPGNRAGRGRKRGKRRS